MGKRDRGRGGWSFSIIFVIVSVVVGVGIAVGIPVKVFWDLKSNGAYRQGMDIARKDAAVIEVFGEPVNGGFFVVGTIKGFGYGPRVASLDVSISGPRAHGILYVFGREREDRQWRVTDMSIDIGGKRVLLWDEEHPEKGFHP